MRPSEALEHDLLWLESYDHFWLPSKPEFWTGAWAAPSTLGAFRNALTVGVRNWRKTGSVLDMTRALQVLRNERFSGAGIMGHNLRLPPGEEADAQELLERVQSCLNLATEPTVGDLAEDLPQTHLIEQMIVLRALPIPGPFGGRELIGPLMQHFCQRRVEHFLEDQNELGDFFAELYDEEPFWPEELFTWPLITPRHYIETHATIHSKADWDAFQVRERKLTEILIGKLDLERPTLLTLYREEMQQLLRQHSSLPIRESMPDTLPENPPENPTAREARLEQEDFEATLQALHDELDEGDPYNYDPNW